MLSPIREERVSKARVERALRDLGAGVPSGAVRTDEETLRSHAGDESENDDVLPDAVVIAENAEQIARVLQAADANDVPVTPRAGGSGKSGGAIPVAGGIVLATAGLARILEIDPREQIAIVEPGVVLGDLHRAVEAEGLFYPPDANSLGWCQLGGNIAENAAGPRALKYGATRNYVLGLDVATMGGGTSFIGKRTKKGVTGYDMTSLLVGSEGTLAVTTRAWLGLLPKPERVLTLLALFPDVHACGRAVVAVTSSGELPRCMEILDKTTLSAIRDRGLDLDPLAGAMLIIEVDGIEAACDTAAERVGGACMENGALTVLVAKDEAQRDKLWEARRLMSPTTRAMAKFKVSEDVVVPRTKIPSLLDQVDTISAKRGVRMLTYGHAGDGNLHVNFLWDDLADEPRVRLALQDLFAFVIAMGGTLTGEHGIGLSKRAFLSLEQEESVIALQRGIKRVFDPKGLLNPHKIFATRHGGC